MRILLLGIVILLTTGCTSSSGHRTKQTKEAVTSSSSNESSIPAVKNIETSDDMIQVKFFDGRVNNIKDDIGLRPKVGDTIIYVNYAYTIDTTLHYGNFIWGYYIKGKVPKNIYNEENNHTDYWEYYPTIVIKN